MNTQITWRLQKVNGLETSLERGTESRTLTREERQRNAVNSRGAAFFREVTALRAYKRESFNLSEKRTHAPLG